MPSVLVLIGLATLCVARIDIGTGFLSSSDVANHDVQFSGASAGEHDDHRDRAQRRHDKAVVDREERHERHKDDRRSSESSESDSDFDYESPRVHHLGRIENRIHHSIDAMIQSALHEAQTEAKLVSQPYQLRCGRNATEGANSVNDTAANRTVGPLVIVIKNTLSDVTSDSFDGNNDGQLDVLEARNNWEQSSGPQANQAPVIDKFVLAIRNRATVNGGSIGLRGLVRTGRHVITTKKSTKNGNFLTFSANTVLITPCFPITTEPNLNVVIYAGGLKTLVFNHTLLESPTVNASSLYTLSPTGTPTFSDGTVTVPLPRRTGSQAGVVEGQCVFQKCTQFSYFQ